MATDTKEISQESVTYVDGQEYLAMALSNRKFERAVADSEYLGLIESETGKLFYVHRDEVIGQSRKSAQLPTT